jgi:hypothetical protein
MPRLCRCMLALLVVLPPATTSGQEPASPPPGPGARRDAGGPVHELLPDLGRIGAQVGLGAGPSWNPYEIGRGVQGAGYVDLPLLRVPGGRLSYQILVALSGATSAPFTLTDPVAYVANLAAGALPADALAGPPRAPFPVRRLVRTRLRLLEVSPFALKYTLTGLDAVRLRPYLLAGLDAVVVITRQTPERDESLLFTGSSPFDAPLIGGLVAEAPELLARHTPTGQGDIQLGFHAAGGLEVRLSGAVSMNLEYRHTRMEGGGGALHALGTSVGFHW